MMSKKELCDELVCFAKTRLGPDFNSIYSSDAECYEDFEKVLNLEPLNAILEVASAITDLVIEGDMENDENKKLCENYLKLAYKINIYAKKQSKIKDL